MLTDEIGNVPYFRVNGDPAVSLAVVPAQLAQGDRAVRSRLHLRIQCLLQDALTKDPMAEVCQDKSDTGASRTLASQGRLRRTPCLGIKMSVTGLIFAGPHEGPLPSDGGSCERRSFGVAGQASAKFPTRRVSHPVETRLCPRCHGDTLYSGLLFHYGGSDTMDFEGKYACVWIISALRLNFQ